MGRADLTAVPGARADVAVVGAGPVGLTLAARLAQHGCRAVVLEQTPHHIGEGSKALCMQRETLETWARIGIGGEVAARGIQWRIGRTYFRERELFHVELPGTTADHFPPFVNISQTEVEERLLDRCRALGVDLRWGRRLAGLTDDGTAVRVALATDSGEEELSASYAVGADGAHSTLRQLAGIGFPGHTHDDRFLICDIRAHLPFPNERRFFFDPPWNRGRQVLIHPQPDDLWRIDWQIPPEADIEAEAASGALDRRIRAVIGADTAYEVVWRTVYRFHQRLADRFRAGRVFLVGDAAHLYAPFGARGLNSGATDAENLAWKLALVVRGEAPDALLDTYATERRAAAVENLAVTDATMRFMVPHGPWQRLWRNLTLRGSSRFAALRRRVNSGRLAEPFVYPASPVIRPGAGEGPGLVSGMIAPDAALGDGSRVRDHLGVGFVVVLAGVPRSVAARAEALSWPLAVHVLAEPALDGTYGSAGPRAWIVRPDGYLAASQPLAGPHLSSEAPDPLERLPDLVAAAAGRAAGEPRPA